MFLVIAATENKVSRDHKKKKKKKISTEKAFVS